MDPEEMKVKIENVKNGKSESEKFFKVRPPEEFGDAVELYYNNQEQIFTAVVYDPQTSTIFDEKNIATSEEVESFINKTVI
ncbi:hypothetical protein [Bacillus alkalicellulosilyticus]|uniref:hypothetical protein n=1 Tax=Alkalihalobacterium alkalicellulosilyticum TaxID=1912214 RepID=UPI00099640C7|nr:hypothetical protein [Bacillus alkalicellulosilyticus]